MNGLEDRDLRQRDLIPPNELRQCRPTVIGVGAIGRQVALQLSAIGVPWLQLIDFDTVEPVNLAAQGFLETDLGRPKVQATGEMCHRVNPQLELVELNSRFRRSEPLGNVVFCCVDDIDCRRRIHQSVQDGIRFFCDGRMSAETVRIVTCTADQPESWDRYPRTLFAAAEAFTGPCTAKSTIFTANIAAGLMLEQFSRYLRRMMTDFDLQLNLLASELTVHSLPH